MDRQTWIASIILLVLGAIFYVIGRDDGKM